LLKNFLNCRVNSRQKFKNCSHNFFIEFQGGRIPANLDLEETLDRRGREQKFKGKISGI